jgi:hypothetical protein
MFSKKNIVVTIGNYGSVVALHENKEVKKKIFLEELNDKAKEELRGIFTSNKTTPIYILIDTIDQSYRKKTYPFVRRSDLTRLVNRDIANDVDKESFRNYIILNNKNSTSKVARANRRWECLFVSSSSSETVNSWIDFLLDSSGLLVGIYMLPVETFSLLKSLKKDIKNRSKVKNKKNDLYCVILQNKASGIRQIVFSDSGIVFTRIVNYDFSKPDEFAEKYEQDIYSTFEYLKRLFPDVTISDLSIVNIMPDDALETIKKLNSTELNIINYTPYEVAAKIGEPKLLPKNSASCDLIISKCFFKNKKILKFSTAKIAVFEKFFIAFKLSYYLNLVLIIATIAAMAFSFFSRESLKQVIASAEAHKNIALIELSKIHKMANAESSSNEEIESVSIERVTDFGKIHQAVGSVGTDPKEFYAKLKFLAELNVKLNKFTYAISGFNQKSPSSLNNYNISIAGDMKNSSGDIEDLFSEFDNLVASVKENLGENKVNYTSLPRNIDFNKKYYSFPVDFRISK